MKKYPIPAVLIAEREGVPGTYEIIDGLQRLHSIVSFIKNSFKLEYGKYFNIEYFSTAKSASAEGFFTTFVDANYIFAKEVSTILDYSLALSVMRNATDAEVNDVFDRINTYGHRLSDQERRQAGVQNEFSTIVRELACILRGDSSNDILLFQSMPSISIDLPMANHEYEVKADEVFWVNQGILRSTDLRDSLDEQCITDILACIVGGQFIERSKDALDEIYTEGSFESERILNCLDIYGPKKIADEIKYCVSEILKICSANPLIKLRDLVFEKRSTNAFPSVFAGILIAIHETVFLEDKIISDYAGVKDALNDLSNRIDTSRRASVAEERRKNVNTIKGLIGPFFLHDKLPIKQIYNNHNVVDIDAIIRRSEIELGNYELKQGLLDLKPGHSINRSLVDKVVKTICAIANIGCHSRGTILIGVTDKKSDADRIKSLDAIEPKKIGKRFVVGINREALRLGISTEQYFSKWKDAIRKSKLSDGLRDSVLSNMDYNSYYGLGLIVITIPPQHEVSYLGDELYWRNSDSTEQATAPKTITAIASRF